MFAGPCEEVKEVKNVNIKYVELNTRIHVVTGEIERNTFVQILLILSS